MFYLDDKLAMFLITNINIYTVHTYYSFNFICNYLILKCDQYLSSVIQDEERTSQSLLFEGLRFRDS